MPFYVVLYNKYISYIVNNFKKSFAFISPFFVFNFDIRMMKITFSPLNCRSRIPESIAYEWGRKPGLIRFTYPFDKRPDTRVDMLSLGFITPLQNAVLVRVDSQASNDYIELEVVSSKGILYLYL